MYNDIILLHYLNAQHMGSLAQANAIGCDGIPDQGPYLKIYLKVEEEHIREASFETYGCPTAVACGEWLTTWSTGKAIHSATGIKAGELAAVLGGLPLGKEHCAELAVNALKFAIREFQVQLFVGNDNDAVSSA